MRNTLGRAGGGIVRVRDFIARTGVRHVYHFTSVANLPSIRQHGLLSYREMRSRGLTPTVAGGDDTSRLTDDNRGLDQYVHLCFVSDNPMEYVSRARLGGTKFLQVSIEVFSLPGVMGCPKLANSVDATLQPIEDILDQISIEALFGGWQGGCVREPYARYDQARRAEILVPGMIAAIQIVNL